MYLRNYLVGKMLKKWEMNDERKLAGKQLPDGVVEIRNVPYCEDNIDGHLLDIYYPEKHGQKLPVIIDLHGGGFMCSNKDLNRLYGHHLAKRGFLVFNLNYRLAFSETTVPGQIKDIANATRWISNNLEQYDGNCDKVFISGHSAGGVLAMMEVLISRSQRMRDLFQIQQVSFKNYQGIVIDCGMMTFYENTIGYWGMRSMCFDRGYKKTDYYNNMIWGQIPEMKDLPKIYLISNEKDELRHMTLAFKSILDNNNLYCKMNFQQDKALGHMAIIYNPDSEDCSMVIDDMIKFLLNN